MYIILTYDVGEKRVAKMPRVLRKYLKHVQLSVFEGEITPANLEKMKKEIEDIIDDDVDSVRIYILRTERAFKVDIIGIDTMPSNIV